MESMIKADLLCACAGQLLLDVVSLFPVENMRKHELNPWPFRSDLLEAVRALKPRQALDRRNFDASLQSLVPLGLQSTFYSSTKAGVQPVHQQHARQ